MIADHVLEQSLLEHPRPPVRDRDWDEYPAGGSTDFATACVLAYGGTGAACSWGMSDDASLVPINNDREGVPLYCSPTHRPTVACDKPQPDSDDEAYR